MEQAEKVVAKLLGAGQTLATAESCTGGLIGHLITGTPGASGCFPGGIIAYSNEIKVRMLGVLEETLQRVGAVSEDVALEMAEGVRSRFGATWGIGVTGIAGPGGGTEEKPVGLVFIAVAGPDGAEVRRNTFSGDRDQVKEQTAGTALDMLQQRIL